MTLLQIVNNVLRRLRESEVSTLTTDYTLTVVDFINDAKRQVEDAWMWNALRDTFDITTASGTATYSLTNSEQRTVIESVTNDTDGVFLQRRGPVWYQREMLNPAGNASPRYYVIDGTDSNGDMQIKLYATPDGTYSVTVNAWVRQADLAEVDDILLVPSTPVIHLAYALAARERGEVGGASALELFSMAQRTLSDAIALDEVNSVGLTDWETV